MPKDDPHAPVTNDLQRLQERAIKAIVKWEGDQGKGSNRAQQAGFLKGNAQGPMTHDLRRLQERAIKSIVKWECGQGNDSNRAQQAGLLKSGLLKSYGFFPKTMMSPRGLPCQADSPRMISPRGLPRQAASPKKKHNRFCPDDILAGLRASPKQSGSTNPLVSEKFSGFASARAVAGMGSAMKSAQDTMGSTLDRELLMGDPSVGLSETSPGIGLFHGTDKQVDPAGESECKNLMDEKFKPNEFNAPNLRRKTLEDFLHGCSGQEELDSIDKLLKERAPVDPYVAEIDARRAFLEKVDDEEETEESASDLESLGSSRTETRSPTPEGMRKTFQATDEDKQTALTRVRDKVTRLRSSLSLAAQENDKLKLAQETCEVNKQEDLSELLVKV